MEWTVNPNKRIMERKQKIEQQLNFKKSNQTTPRGKGSSRRALSNWDLLSDWACAITHHSGATWPPPLVSRVLLLYIRYFITRRVFIFVKNKQNMIILMKKEVTNKTKIEWKQNLIKLTLKHCKDEHKKIKIKDSWVCPKPKKVRAWSCWSVVMAVFLKIQKEYWVCGSRSSSLCHSQFLDGIPARQVLQ